MKFIQRFWNVQYIRLVFKEFLSEAVKVELLKPTKPKICIFMPFVDTNSHLTTKPSYFDIKCHSNSESYDRHGFLGPTLGVVVFLFLYTYNYKILSHPKCSHLIVGTIGAFEPGGYFT